MRVHALVADAAAAEQAIADGATVVQLRIKGTPADDVVEVGRSIRAACAAAGVTFVVNDDVDAALRAGADGVHLGRDDVGAERARTAGVLLGLSAASVAEALEAEAAGASYVGAGPVWETPSKPDAGPPLGLDGLAAISRAVAVPVVAIGGVDASNAGDCIRAGAAGVAVIRAVAELREVRAAVDAALARA
ncbi:MAG TPA: thiamine phosphate synthase [Gaiellaceae bacterium]|jgi:thiamine-phosphate pyrophosphorylase|nr:thiamine phosphate synthase [Gaiellaceae bacterium]